MTNVTRSVLVSWTTGATPDAVDVLVALRRVLSEVDAWKQANDVLINES